MEGLLKYLDEQIEAARDHTAAALQAFDEKAVHQARVATRRLKAGLELLEPLLAKRGNSLGKNGNALRRRLGPLRDLDVMVAAVANQLPTSATAAALEWLHKTLEHQRRKARLADQDKHKSPAKLIGRFDDWWKLRHDLQADVEAIGPLLASAVHQRFARFAEQADLICGVAELPHGSPPVDVHQVRIEGKALRYTLEMADAAGVRLSKKVMRSFKTMQQALGEWHDHVVLYETTLRMIVKKELALHSPALAQSSTELAKIFLSKSIKSLAAFRVLWKKTGTEIQAGLLAAMPLVTEPPEQLASNAVESETPTAAAESHGRSEAASESKTGPDRQSTETSEPPELSPEDAQRAT